MKRTKLFLLSSLILSSCSFLQPETSNLKHVQSQLQEGANRERYEAISDKYMVSTQGDYSTQAAVEILKKGGNLVDAAIAASFAISVERPQSTGIGGGGFMLIHMAKDNKTYAYDFREMAPLAANKDMYLDHQGELVPRLSLDGPLAAGVPGLVSGLVDIHERFGKLPLKEVISPAIELADKGFPIYQGLARAIEYRAEVLLESPAAKKIFFDTEGMPLKEGQLLVQKDLAKSLRAIASDGKKSFYTGWIAKAIASSQKKSGGIISLQDLKNYQTKEREPIRAKYLDYEILSMPPPSSGGAHVIQILNILEQAQLNTETPLSPKNIHYTASAMQLAFADRAEYLGDSDFVKVPLQGLTSKEYAQELFKSIPENKARPSGSVKPGPAWKWDPKAEPDHTIHFTMMDASGNTITSTQTINGLFGAAYVVEGTGIVLNNEMDDFSAKAGAQNLFGAVGYENNSIAPKKRPLSSMSPTIVTKDGKPLLALGSPSGTRIITCVAQTVLNYLTYDKNLYDSVASIRYHHQWRPDEIRVDVPGFPQKVQESLEEMGYKVNTSNLGCRVNAVAREDGKLRGVSDPRGEGRAMGL